MGELTDQLAIVIGVLAACFAGPGAAMFFLARRKKKARQLRRSPIGITLLRAPGHSLRDQLDEANKDLMWDIVLLMVMPLLVLALVLTQSHLRGLQQVAHIAVVYGVGLVAFIACMLRKLLRVGNRRTGLLDTGSVRHERRYFVFQIAHPSRCNTMSSRVLPEGNYPWQLR